MQLSLRPYVTAGVAIAGAGVIAVTPITPTPTALAAQTPAIHSSSAAVELTALADALDTSSWVDPIGYWGEVLATTQTNLSMIAEALAADPFPVLSQVIENQAGYADTISTALSSGADNLVQFVTGDTASDLPALLAKAQDALNQGDVNGAAQQITYILTEITFALAPMFPILSIPGQIAENFGNVIQTLGPQWVDGSLNYGIIALPITGLLTMAQNGVQALGTFGQALVDAATTGDPVAALSTIVNAPAFFTDSILNGRVIIRRPPWPPGRGLGILNLNPSNWPNWSPAMAFVYIPRVIAEAITPPEDPAATAKLASASTASDIALPAAATDVDTAPEASTQTDTVKALTSGITDAVNKFTGTPTSVVDAVKSVTLDVAPQAGADETAPAATSSTDVAVAGDTSGTTNEPSATSTTAADNESDTSAESAKTSPVKADKESKKETRKEARAAKREARQQARTERQQANHEAKADKHTTKSAKSGSKHRAGKKTSDND
ncbi:hypothetical protein VST63_22385 [Mycolicibacterium sp. 050232]|uniref:hypothetical protein n=1 Tax=Mycolicibacterium sp. 050232 TaxID=3113982 RepID=UPI002E2A1E82|nr:hypothetical protein [Mycolicibacterium sp. 050232]MED5815118.1 hypothetical protein [Mycolicibacterium sp. 050232]